MRCLRAGSIFLLFRIAMLATDTAAADLKLGVDFAVTSGAPLSGSEKTKSGTEVLSYQQAMARALQKNNSMKNLRFSFRSQENQL